MKAVLILACALVLSTSAIAAQTTKGEVSVGGGWSFMLKGVDSAEGLSKNGLALGVEAFYDFGFLPGLKLGLTGDYLTLTRITAGTGDSEISQRSYTIPIMVAGKYTLMDNLYAELGLGISISKSSVSVGSAIPAAQKALLEAAADVSSTDFAAMVGVGYSIPVMENFTIDPRAKFHFVFANTTFIQATPTLNFVYHF